MLFFRKRIDTPELMDQPERVSRTEMVGALTGIRRVNRFLGGTRAMIDAIDPMLAEARRRKIRTVRLCDIGTGAADIPMALVKHAAKRRIDLHIVAVEWNPDLAAHARERTGKTPQVTVINADGREVLRAAARQPIAATAHSHGDRRAPARSEPFHIVTASLFLHHFPPPEVVDWISLMQGAASIGWVVNDLERALHAYLGFRVLGPVLSRNPVFLHDGALSVKRAYTRDEWLALARRARALQPRITRRFPARIVMTGRGSAITD